MSLDASKTLKSGAKIQYLCTLVPGEALRQFDTFFAEIGSANPENLTSIILGLYMYFFPVNALSKKNCAVRRVIRKSRGLKAKMLPCSSD